MKNSIFAVGEYFDDHEDFDRHWLAFFTQLETRHNTTDRPEEPHGLLQSLLDSLSRQQPAALVPYDESHMAETTESILHFCQHASAMLKPQIVLWWAKLARTRSMLIPRPTAIEETLCSN